MDHQPELPFPPNESPQSNEKLANDHLRLVHSVETPEQPVVDSQPMLTVSNSETTEKPDRIGLEATKVTYERSGKQIVQQRFYETDENGKKRQLKNDAAREELAPHMEKLFQIMAGASSVSESPKDLESAGPSEFQGYEPGLIDKVPTDKLNRLLDAAVSRAAQADNDGYQPGYDFAIKHAEIFFDELVKRYDIKDDERDRMINSINQRLNDLTGRDETPSEKPEISGEPMASPGLESNPPMVDVQADTERKIQDVDARIGKLIAAFREAREKGAKIDAIDLQEKIEASFVEFCDLKSLSPETRQKLELKLLKAMLTPEEYEGFINSPNPGADKKKNDDIKILEDDETKTNDDKKIKILDDDADKVDEIKIIDDLPENKTLRKRLSNRVRNIKNHAYSTLGMKFAGVSNAEVMNDDEKATSKKRKIIGAIAVIGAGAAAYYIGKKAGFDIAPSIIDGDGLDLNGATGFNGVDVIPWVDGDGLDFNGTDAIPKVVPETPSPGDVAQPVELNVTDNRLPWAHVSDKLGGENSTPKILELVNKGASHGWKFVGNGLGGGEGGLTSVTTPNGITYTDNGHINAALDLISGL